MTSGKNLGEEKFAATRFVHRLAHIEQNGFDQLCFYGPKEAVNA